YSVGRLFAGSGSQVTVSSNAASLSGSAGVQINSAFPPVGTPSGAPGINIVPTPNSSGDLFLRVPCIVHFKPTSSTAIDTDFRIYGEIDGVFAINGAGILIPENRIEEDGVAFKIL